MGKSKLNLKNMPLPLVLAIVGAWILVVFIALLTVITVEHWTLNGWIFTLILTNTVLILVGFAVVLYYIQEKTDLSEIISAIKGEK